MTRAFGSERLCNEVFYVNAYQTLWFPRYGSETGPRGGDRIYDVYDDKDALMGSLFDPGRPTRAVRVPFEHHWRPGA